MSSTYAENEVFSFCGHLEGELGGELKSGYAVAQSAEEAIRSMRECGFYISAITSLAEVKQTVSILELIAHRHPDIEPTDYVDVYPAEIQPYPESNVFCLLVCRCGSCSASTPS